MRPPTRLKRNRLMPAWALMVSVCLGLIGIAFIFPKASLFQQLIQGDKEERADSVRVILLQSLLQKGVQGFALHREYIRQLILTQNFQLAFEELSHLDSSWKGGSRDSLWLLEIESGSLALSFHNENLKWPLQFIRLGSKGLMRFGQPTSLALAVKMVKQAGEYALAAQLYLRMADLDSLPLPYQTKAIAMFSQVGDCQSEAKVWMSIFESHKNALAKDDKGKRAFISALKSLEACNDLDAALNLAESHFKDWRDDTEVLLYLVQLARSANHSKLAERYAQWLVKPLAAGPEP